MIRRSGTCSAIHASGGLSRDTLPAAHANLQVAQAVPYEPPVVELVVEDAGTALAVPADRSVAQTIAASSALIVRPPRSSPGTTW
jgi:hypothetical protein